jgi:rare lipoprotein A
MRFTQQKFFQQVKKLLFSLLLMVAMVLPALAAEYDIQSEGKASWIGERFQGKKTASGELFDMNDLTGSHATLPFGSVVKVTSKKTGKSVNVRVNNRSEIDNGRVIDVSRRAAEQIGLIEEGIGLVNVQVVSVPNQKVVVNTPAASKPSVQPTINTSQQQAVSYQIQYGSFFDLDNAVDLRDALKKKNIDTEIDTVKSTQRQSYRVISNQKFSNRQDAKTALANLAPQEGVIISVLAPQPTVASSTPSSSPKPASAVSTSKGFEYGAQFGAFKDVQLAKDLQTSLLTEKSIRTIIHQFPDDERKLYRVLTNKAFSTKEETMKYLKDNKADGIILTFVK